MNHTNAKNVLVNKIKSSKSKIMKLLMAGLLLATLNGCGSGAAERERLQRENERLELESKTQREIEKTENDFETERQKAEMEAAEKLSKQVPQVYSWREETDEYIIIHQESDRGTSFVTYIPKGLGYDCEVTSGISVTNAVNGTREAQNTVVVESGKTQNNDTQDMSNPINEEQIIDTSNDTINKE